MRRLTVLIAAVAVLVLVGIGAVMLTGDDEPVELGDDLVANGASQWRYLDDGSDPAEGRSDAAAWAQPDFDDSDWSTGTGSFGAKNGKRDEVGDGTVPDNRLDQYDSGENNSPAFFFRTDFDVDAAQLSEDMSLTSTVHYDDAATIFLNGTRVAGLDDGGIGSSPEDVLDNQQYAGPGLGSPRERTFTLDADVLVPGTNTLAIRLHQADADSSDVFLDVETMRLIPTPEPTGPTSLLLGVGKDPSERLLSWFTDTGEDEVVQIAAGEHGALPEDAFTFRPTARDAAADGENDYVHAALTDLSADTSYTYRVGSDEGGWTDTATFRTPDTDPEHSFTFVGDPQVGSSGDAEADTAAFEETLATAEELFPDSHFVLTAGDQVSDHSDTPDEFRAYLAPEAMRTQTFAHTLGNHDYGEWLPPELFSQHVPLPHAWEDDPTRGTYWFTHNDVLHLNVSTEIDPDTIERFLRTVIEGEGGDASWTILTFHRSLFGSGEAHSQTERTQELRDGLAPVISDLDIDLVLTGHDHAYTRSHPMDGTEVGTHAGTTAAEADSGPADDAGSDDDAGSAGGHDVAGTEDGVVYITANSSSGSKYYDLVDEELTPWAAVRDQSEVTTVSNVEVTHCSLVVTTVRTDTHEPIDTVEIARDCG